MTLDSNKQYANLVMGDKTVGLIHIDKDTGEITGTLFDEQLRAVTLELFPQGLIEVSFMGKIGIPYTDARAKMDAFLKKEGE